ncbi:aldehyde dehydrogenase [Acidaminobacter sp. JC074]|uniref:aldehyde dehydrogenase n=1 Tax=Acidaminobacter sp. JC074 TaxID=2530199 RepID=UPI001F0EE89A|nr:aldehyde dehydrogenase [Acidaminobacter sp. JC074]MCH4887595.1 aldehyde dehydrogenase [Acidaminobacter sp. JC074]
MVRTLLENQKMYYHEGHTQSVRFRMGQLQKLRDAIKKYELDIIDALYKDLRKPAFEAYTHEVGFVLESITFTMKRLKKWLRHENKKVPLHQFGSKGYLTYEPYGSVLIIGPFNYPFQLLIEPLIGAIAAGNTAILKPSSDTPHTEAVIVKMIQETFDDQFISIVTGGREITTELINSPFDYMFFTGSVNVGKVVMEAASKNLVPVTLELGGKSPTIVDKSANINIAAKRIAWGKFLNAGQTCIAPDYVYVHEKVADKFKVALKKHLLAFYGADPKESPDYGRVVSEKHFNRLTEMIQGDVIIGGDSDIEDKYIEPTVIDNVTWDEPIMADEIFGPILPIMTYSDLDDVIFQINSRPKPLALYLFTTKKSIEKKVLQKTSSGGMAINDTITHITSPYLPFGGVGHSGMGAYHGRYSFETFSHRRSLIKKSNLIDLAIAFPPYKDKVKLVKKIMK